MTNRHIDEYWAEVGTYNPLNMHRQEHVAVLAKIWIEDSPVLEKHREKLTELFYKSHGQVYQDMFVLMYLGYKTNGYFVEFGATDGYDISNTYILEKDYGWSGILAEPATQWHEKLAQNRNCHIDHSVIWRANEPVLFNERERGDASLAVEYMGSVTEPWSNDIKEQYEVSGITLNNLLVKYNAPNDIDYISMDTEGNEIDILETFNFDKYRVKFFTVEHNYREDNRNRIYQLLTSKGYDRVLIDLSQQDDFYALKEYNNI